MISDTRLSQLKAILAEEGCGLFFLAGLDMGKTPPIVTVHAANGTIGTEQIDYIQRRIHEFDTALELEIRTHSPSDLYAPDSLEGFASLFTHEHVVADPTGAFTRAPRLLEMAAKLRSAFGEQIDRILWRTGDAALVVVAAAQATCISISGKQIATDRFEAELKAFVGQTAIGDLAKVVRSVRVVAGVVPGSYVPVDASSVVRLSSTPAKTKAAGALTRAAGAAAIIGLGTVAAAATDGSVNAAPDAHYQSPGITALSDLTTLGENSLGVRNHFRAVGGLRLYLGESGVILASAASTLGAGFESGVGRRPPQRLLDVS
ncbi:hypothetical protein ACKTEK_05090 [Tepidamorphus sp. 3E244]|uniref:hypothetical protein n=1 Tax=Tepidamorphus sp. 3E244 TaxID=3385498 RepID=UPI0038FD2B00